MKKIKIYLWTLIWVAFSAGDKVSSQTFTNDVRVYSYSFILPMLSGSGLNVYFSTPDNDGLDWPEGVRVSVPSGIVSADDISAEVAAAAQGSSQYRTDFFVYSSAYRAYIAYGDASIASVPVSTDLNQDGFPDVLQYDQLGTFNSSGQIQYADLSMGGATQTRNVSLRLTRTKGASSGSCNMSYLDNGVPVSLSGTFVVPALAGKAVLNKSANTFTSTLTLNAVAAFKSDVTAAVGISPGENKITLTNIVARDRSNNTPLVTSYLENLVLTQRVSANFRGYAGQARWIRSEPAAPFASFVDRFVVVDCPDTDEDGSLDLTDDTPLGVPSTFTGTGQVVGEVGKAVAPVTVGVSPSCRNFVATGLPPGLAINLTSGVISGTPTTAGIYPFSVTARVKAGLAPATTNFLAWVSGAAQTLPFTDDFSRVVPNRYLFSSTNALPRMIVTNGLLEYRSTNPPQNTAWATPSLLLTLTNSWDLQVDTRVPTNWPVGGGEAKVGVSLLKEVPGGTFADILPNRINLKFGVGPEGNSFQYHYHVNDTETLGANLIATNGGVARLRFLFHGGTRTLTLYGASYTGTNLSPWTKLGEETLAPGQGLGEGWGLALTNRLRLALWGETDAEDGNANGTRRMALDNLSVALVTPPRITGTTNFNGQVGVSFSNRLTATNGQTYFTATNLPAGLTLDETNGIISGVPETAGRFTNARVGVGNPAAASDTPVSFTLLPAFISSNAVTGLVNDGGFSHRVEVSTNNFGSNLRFSAAGLPTGMNINASNGLISGRPTVVGEFPATISISAFGATASRGLWFSIAQTNSGRFQAGSSFSYQFSFGVSGFSNYAASNLPPGLSITPTGLIRGTPAAESTNAVLITARGPGNTLVSTNLPLLVLPAAPVVQGPAAVIGQVGIPLGFAKITTARELVDRFDGPGLNPAWTEVKTQGTVQTTVGGGRYNFGVPRRTTNETQNSAGAVPLKNLFYVSESFSATVGARNLTPTNSRHPNQAQLLSLLWPRSGAKATIGVVLDQGDDDPPNFWHSFSFSSPADVSMGSGVQFWPASSPEGSLRMDYDAGRQTFSLYVSSVGMDPFGLGSGDWEFLREFDLNQMPQDFGGGDPVSWNLRPTNQLAVALSINSWDVAFAPGGIAFDNFWIRPTDLSFHTGTNLPAGLACDPGTGLISGIPTSAGVFSNVALRATNTGGVGARNATFVILPAFTSSNAVTGFVNDAGLSHQVVVGTHNFSSNLRFSAARLPNGMSINASNGLISGRPTVAGAFPATVTITALGASASQRVDFTIHGAAGGAFSLTLSPRPTNVLNLPTGLSYYRSSGVISGTPQGWGSFTATGQLSNGTTTNISIPVMPSVPVIAGPTNWNAQVGQETKYQIVAGGFGREWAGWDGFDGAAPSTNWLSSGPLAAFRTNAASKSGVGIYQGRLSLTHGGVTNQTGSGYLVWARTIPVGAKWVAMVDAGISTNLNLVRRTNSLGQPTNGQWIATKLNLLRGGSELTDPRQLSAEYVRSPEEGNLLLARTNSNGELGKLSSPSDLAGLAIRYDEWGGGTIYSLGFPEGPIWQTLHSLSVNDWGLAPTNQWRLALGGFSEFFLLEPGAVWFDDFVVLPDPDALMYRAYLIGTNGLALTNESGNPYLPEGLELNSSGCITGLPSSNLPGGNYRIRVEAEYNPALMPLPGLPAVRGGTNVTLTLLPAFIGASSVEGRVNDPAFRHQILLGTNNFGSNLRFSASNLPTGTAINATSGVISGRPTVAGTFSATVTITAFGASASQRVDFSLPAAVGGQFNLILNPRPTNITGLPAGLIYNRTTGMISGIPQLAGQFEAVGQLSGGATTNLPISVLPSVPVIVSPTNAVAKVGEEFFYQIVPGGPGREWAGFDNFETATSTNWTTSTNQRNASMLRSGGVTGGLVFRPGSTNSNTQRSAQFWRQAVPGHVSWMALVDAAVTATHLPGTFEFGLAAVQIEGRAIAPGATPPQLQNILWNRIRQSGFSAHQATESLLEGVPWMDLFAGRTEVAGFSGNELGFANTYTIYGGGLSMISNQVVYRSTAPGSFGIFPPLRLGVHRSWTATARVKMGDDWTIQHADISLGVMKAPQARTPRVANLSQVQMMAAATNRFVVKMGRNIRDGNYYGYHGYSAGGYDDDGTNQITPSRMGWLRLSYDATNRALSSAYDPDDPGGETILKVESLDWDDPNSLGALWGLDSNASFWIFLSGGTEGSGNGNSPSRMAIDWFSVDSSDDSRFSQEGIGQGICAFGYDADAKEISSFRWDPEGETLVEMGKVSVADWQISNNSSFGLFLSGMALSTGLTATTPCGVFDNFVLMPWKEEFTYEVVNGALPGGVSLGASGSISGNPTAPGNFQATIRVTGAGGTTTHSLSLVVQP